MRYTDKLTGLAVLLLLAACGNSSGDGDHLVMDTTIQPPAAVTTVTNTGTNTQTVVPPVAAPVTGNTGALNPEHGKPGHRCDIAVGAPLNSQPTVNTTPGAVTTNQPAVTTTFPSSPAATIPAATNTVASNTAPGMNPAHGQPGHRCDIAVGAPLNSKPTTPATTTTPLSLNPSVPAATPVVTKTPVNTQPTTAPITATTTTAPGMNPPHGQPGHRCDIAVGTPLNSPPTAPVDKKGNAVNNPSPANNKVLTPSEKEKQELERNKEADKAPTKGN